ncbi:MAG: hypothetical protein HY595_04015, partial [Candidatus Omnitrophica bacterium]|nr:hypothetical protein [Candidatus Omnitrophota bacterium]
MSLKLSVWLSMACLVSLCALPRASAEERGEKFKGFHSSPRSIYRSLQMSTLCDQDDTRCAYRIDLAEPPIDLAKPAQP